MKTCLRLSGIIVAVALVTAESKLLPNMQSCTTDSDCSPEQCCIINTGQIIMSKRFAPGISKSSSACTNYLRVNDTCAGAWRIFGSCGCGPGLYCHYYPDEKPTVGKRGVKGWEKKRKILAPGRYVCEVDNRPTQPPRS
ncbi:uncharacterized protein LOC121367835 [Gigantopelta aegis]|uniref:uncharacterized protein LOC121367835 n=1 Tax=Gigantopelta aegis TaxID=1735272 RepID=UPI001B88D8E0|nr:uncharacterized protein LOC121367835 [Gigantopelta aegis]